MDESTTDALAVIVGMLAAVLVVRGLSRLLWFGVDR